MEGSKQPSASSMCASLLNALLSRLQPEGVAVKTIRKFSGFVDTQEEGNVGVVATRKRRSYTNEGGSRLAAPLSSQPQT